MNYRHNRDLFIAPILEWAEANKEKAEHAVQPMFKSEKKSGSISETRNKVEEQNPFKVPLQFNGKDFITMLLHIDAEIEHGLMLQYLYSAYSLGGPQIPENYQPVVNQWRNIILGIAKEEMGHFISVQNVLKVIGSPLNFGRESYPWDTPFYPFPFALEKFSLPSLAKYIYAEAPAKWLDNKEDPLVKEIIALVDAEVSDPHTVGALFKILLQLINDPNIIPDETFQPTTYPYQAKFDEWGRGYTDGERGSAGKGKFETSPDVLVVPLLSRDDAYNALAEIAEQGEGDKTNEETTPSHFERFLHIYKECKQVLADSNNSFEPARNVASNPCLLKTTEEESLITNPEAILWANLFNIRYRLLLNFLSHSFLLDNGFNSGNVISPRGMIINSTFGEMYNLRSLSAILVQIPIGIESTEMAGPPFTLPYTFDLPFGEHNRWRLHKDLLIASSQIIEQLKGLKTQTNRQYLNALQEIDRKLLSTIAQLTEVEQA